MLTYIADVFGHALVVPPFFFKKYFKGLSNIFYLAPQLAHRWALSTIITRPLVPYFLPPFRSSILAVSTLPQPPPWRY